MTTMGKLIPGLNSYPFSQPLEFDLESRPATAAILPSFDEKVPPEAKAIFEGALQSAKTRSMGSTISDLTKALSLYPQYMRLLNYLGLQYFNNERYDEASAAFIQALTISHKYPTGLINLGSTWNRQGKYNQAVAVLNYLVNAYPDFTIARLPLADALTRAQQWDEAGEQLRIWLADKNLDASPRAEAHLLLSRVLVREERYIGARAEIEKPLRQSPTGPTCPRPGSCSPTSSSR
ncbi:MAG: tetratricopeptide repeat protein [Acidobacteria bacterium]|nr:tetratricopeptide repeat protein [Acidobacteriota bacterium]